MKQEFFDDLINPITKNKMVLKNPKIENSEIESGILQDNNIEYIIENYIPRFVKKDLNETQKSFEHKWQRYSEAIVRKQKQSRKTFLEQYALNPLKIEQLFRDKNKILDIGCGIGHISNWLSQLTSGLVYGVDLSNSVDIAQKIFETKTNAHLQFLQADIAQLPFKNNFFDIIICKEMIHHTSEPRRNFSKLVKHLKHGGRIFIYVYNKKGPIREFCDDYIRSFTKRLSIKECENFAEIMTEFGKSLREMKISIDVPKDIPYLDINAGKYDLQRFIYQKIFKCWWDDDGDKEYSKAVNFDWYHPPYAFRYSKEEFTKWFRDEGLKIENLNELESGYAVRAIKPQ